MARSFDLKVRSVSSITIKDPVIGAYIQAPPPLHLAPSCAQAGVLGVLPGVIGTLQATEVIKVLLNLGNTLSKRLLLYDALSMHFKELKITKNIVDIANIHSKGRVISFLEGGYDLQALSESIIEHLNALKPHI